jgi:hypothetical protein
MYQVIGLQGFQQLDKWKSGPCRFSQGSGMEKRQKYFTPKQVKKLVEHFDIP